MLHLSILYLEVKIFYSFIIIVMLPKIIWYTISFTEKKGGEYSKKILIQTKENKEMSVESMKYILDGWKEKGVWNMEIFWWDDPHLIMIHLPTITKIFKMQPVLEYSAEER